MIVLIFKLVVFAVAITLLTVLLGAAVIFFIADQLIKMRGR